MIFNDYVIKINSQINELKRLEMLNNKLKDILKTHEEWTGNVFSVTYRELISSTKQNFSAESSSLVNRTKNHFTSIRESLIGIDFLEFGEILSNFNSLGDITLINITNQIVEEYKSNYKIIHSYKTTLNDSTRVNDYVECMNSIKKMVNLYDRFLFLGEYINEINKQLSSGIEDDCLEISLLNNKYEKETYSNVTNPIYVLYEKVCEIGNIDITKEELKIVRMETGSFFIKFVGNKNVLKLIANILESFHKTMIRNYTREGQRQNLVESTELFKEQFDLVKEMNDLGMDVGEHKEIAKETLVLLMKQSNILLSSSPDVRINKKVLSKSEDIKKALERNELKNLPFVDNEDEVVNK